MDDDLVHKGLSVFLLDGVWWIRESGGTTAATGAAAASAQPQNKNLQLLQEILLQR